MNDRGFLRVYVYVCPEAWVMCNYVCDIVIWNRFPVVSVTLTRQLDSWLHAPIDMELRGGNATACYSSSFRGCLSPAFRSTTVFINRLKPN